MNLEFIKGKKLKHQPYNLKCGFRFTKHDDFYKILEKHRYEIYNWCDTTYGMPKCLDRYWGDYTQKHFWWYDCGSTYVYFFFENKKAAMLFKLRWEGI